MKNGKTEQTLRISKGRFIHFLNYYLLNEMSGAPEPPISYLLLKKSLTSLHFKHIHQDIRAIVDNFKVVEDNSGEQ